MIEATKRLLHRAALVLAVTLSMPSMAAAAEFVYEVNGEKYP